MVKQPDKMHLLGYFVLSVIINSLGNALTVSINLGSALWTAASVNLAQTTPVSLSWWLFLSGAIVILTNIIILHHFQTKRIIGNLIFMVPFASLVGIFAHFLVRWGITSLPLSLRVFLDCLGVVLIAVAISLYQRVNWMLHPVDDLMQIIRFRFFKGNSTVAQLVTFTPPLIVIFVIFGLTHHLYAINIGTIFALLFQGTLVGLADQIIFPSLKHQNIANMSQVE
ncbi:YczE/YyaS/YitT family protein [Ligilactobacillus saerimneri]|uniref:YczE/YyaS/YitT family protein n=1 Tax=Ligilactobacillus saerimneri TaxID=228229 RepID=UPI0024BA8DB2|nr:hypothetical protein [Ligilactobacillus saerimneri]